MCDRRLSQAALRRDLAEAGTGVRFALGVGSLLGGDSSTSLTSRSNRRSYTSDSLRKSSILGGAHPVSSRQIFVWCQPAPNISEARRWFQPRFFRSCTSRLRISFMVTDDASHTSIRQAATDRCAHPILITR